MIWSKPKRITVYVATDAELTNPHYYQRLWLAVKNKQIHRRDWLNELANAFLDIDHTYELLNHSGKRYALPEVDDVFADTDMRWLSNFLLSDPSGAAPKMRSRMLERLRLLDLYFRGKHPNIAIHFGR